MRTAYEELQISFREREKLEYSTRTTMESKIGELQENNNNLQGENVLSLETRIFAKCICLLSFAPELYSSRQKIKSLKFDIYVRYLSSFQKPQYITVYKELSSQHVAELKEHIFLKLGQNEIMQKRRLS